MSECSFEDGIEIRPDGVHELSPCVFEDIEMHTNVTVIVSQCKKCGKITIGWLRQENTETIFEKDLD